MIRSSLLTAVLVTACSSTPATTPSPDGGTVADSAAPMPGATLTFTVNGMNITADRNIIGKQQTSSTAIDIGGERAVDGSTPFWSVAITLGNVTGPGTYKCTDSNMLLSPKPRVTFTFDSYDSGNILLNVPDIHNPTGPFLPFTGDCTVTLTAVAAKVGEHYTGTFTALGLQGKAGNVDITNGVFDVVRSM